MMAKFYSIVGKLFLLVLLYHGSLFSQSVFVDSIFSRVSGTDVLIDRTKVDSAASSAIDFVSKPGSFQLSTGLQTNLARGTEAVITFLGSLGTDTAARNPMYLLDGNLGSNSDVIFPGLSNGGVAGSYFIVDLKAVRSISQVRLYTYLNSRRILTYTLFGGLDTLVMEKLYFEKSDTVTSKNYSELIFPTANIRYLKLRIDELVATDYVISDFQAFGPGFLPTGTMYSTIKTLTKAVNFGTAAVEGTIPNLTNVYLSFRSGKNAAIDTTWSNWSDEVGVDNSLFDVPEPRRYFQYRVRITTDTLNSPVVNKVIINYDNDLVVSETNSLISPQEAIVLKEQEFTLRTNFKFTATDLGVDTVRFITPSPVQLINVLFNGAAIAHTAKVTFKEVLVILNSTLKTNGNLDIVFKTTPFIDAKPHTAKASSKLRTNNPQRIDSYSSNGIENWSLILVGVPEKLLNGVKLTKNPFTPNGDGKNDITELEFYLGNIAEPRSIVGSESRMLTVKILDLSGRILRVLFNEKTSAAAFKGEGNPMVWDGRDESGSLVRPGLYLVQVVIDADSGKEQVTKTVVVAY